MKELKISIPKPCHENWDNMLPAGQGRHCASCATVVVDFSQMSTDEIQRYFREKKENKVCGNFKISQIDENISPSQRFLLSLYERLENQLAGNLFRKAALVSLTLLINLSGCHAVRPNHKIGKVKANSPQERMLRGDIEAEPWK